MGLDTGRPLVVGFGVDAVAAVAGSVADTVGVGVGGVG